MSLLIDALRKAEQAKRQGNSVDSGITVEPSLTLETVGADDSHPARPPDATSMAIGATSAQPNDLSDLKHREEAKRSAVHNAFAVKESARPRKNVALLAATAGLLAVGAIGGYFWWQLRPVPSPSAPRPVPAPVAQTGSLPLAPPVASNLPPPSSQGPEVAAVTTSVPPTKPSKIAQRPQASPAEPGAAMTPMRVPSVGVEARVNFAAPQVKPESTVAEAFEAFRMGNLTVARLAYEKLLQADPRNPDALHGLAAVALREGRADAAAVAYLRILEANPSDAAAHAGLVGLDARGDPLASESRIKSLLAAQPDVPVLNFALGNLYARQDRWDEAQQAYFKAVTEDGNNPDYLFNLAVSLDQLHQPRLAAQYYGRALLAAENRPAAFDRAQASNRLRQLQP